MKEEERGKKDGKGRVLVYKIHIPIVQENEVAITIFGFLWF